MENQDLLDPQSEAEFCLDPHDAAIAFEQANKRGLNCEMYVKMLLHEALTREAKAS